MTLGNIQPTGQIVLVRTYAAGVFFGEFVNRNKREVELRNARRIWFWSGAASLSQLAMEGVTNPSECKFAVPVDEILLLDTIEIIPMTDRAIQNVNQVPHWRV